MELELQQRVAVISSSRSSVKGAVAGGHINAAIRVRAQSRVARPDAAFAPVRRNVQHRLLLERLRVVRHHPAVVRIHVAGRAPRKIESLVREQQGRPRVFSQRVELYFPVLASIAPAPNSRRDLLWSAKFLRPRGDCQGMQGLKILVVLEEMADHRACQHVQGSRLQINHRG